MARSRRGSPTKSAQTAPAKAFMRESQIGNALNILGVMIAVGLGSVFALATPIWMGGALLIVLVRGHGSGMP